MLIEMTLDDILMGAGAGGIFFLFFYCLAESNTKNSDGEILVIKKALIDVTFQKDQFTQLQLF